MRHFCTYFDSNYLVKGLALYRSLARHARPFRLWVLCLDAQAYEILGQLALPDLEPVALSDLEAADPELLAVKATRSRVEYYFTSTSALMLYVFDRCPGADLVTYLDADLYFYADPEPAFAELGSGSVLIIGHRFPPEFRYLESRGLYNVGFLVARRDAAGLACLHWWRERCLEWCYDREEPGRFADQKYLDQWPERFAGVVVLQHPGGGLAPWNMANYRYALAGGQVRVDGRPLLFAHMHGLKALRPWLVDPWLANYKVRAGRVLKHHVYGPYLRELDDARRWLSSRSGGRLLGMSSVRGPAATKPEGLRRLAAIGGAAARRLRLALRVLRRELWLVPRGRLL